MNQRANSLGKDGVEGPIPSGGSISHKEPNKSADISTSEVEEDLRGVVHYAQSVSPSFANSGKEMGGAGMITTRSRAGEYRVAAVTHAEVGRLWGKIDRRADGDCWPWMAAASPSGYGRIRMAGGLRLPHRVVYELEKGSIPQDGSYHGAIVMHTCDNPRCCNPAHLSLGSASDNARDCVAKGRHPAKRGEEHPGSVLSESDVAAIRVDARSDRAIALDYGVHHGTISKIRRRERWSHIP